MNLALATQDDPAAVEENRRRVAAAFAPADTWCDIHQVHGAEVDVVEDRRSAARPRADALMTGRAGVTLLVRAADCVPVVLVAAGERLIGAAHSGRPGLVAGVVPSLVRRMRAAGATRIAAWLGPHACGRCYEVPEAMRDEIAAAIPEAYSQTSWGTPALGLSAGLVAQLRDEGVTEVTDIGVCTIESEAQFSYRRQGERAGRHVGLVRLRST